MTPFQRFLLIKLSSLGDVVHCFPIVRAIKKHLPDSHISWVVDDRFLDVARCSGAVDELVPFYRHRWAEPSRLVQTAGELLELRSRMKGSRYDVALDLQGLLRSGLLGWFSGAPVRIGFENGREGSRHLYSVRLPVPNGEAHAINRYLSVLNYLEIPSNVPLDYGIRLPEGTDEAVDREWPKRADEKPWIAVNPNARWTTKIWPAERFAALADKILSNRECRLFFLGSAQDKGRVAEIRSKMNHPSEDLTGRMTIPQLFSFLRKIDLLITNDSGPMHIAAAVGTPIVAIFGPTNPLRTGPFTDLHRIVRKGVSCSPCYHRKCPVGHECMNHLEPDEVFEQVSRFRFGNAEKKGSFQ